MVLATHLYFELGDNRRLYERDINQQFLEAKLKHRAKTTKHWCCLFGLSSTIQEGSLLPRTLDCAAWKFAAYRVFVVDPLPYTNCITIGPKFVLLVPEPVLFSGALFLEY
jgi:hypothetical protein